MRRILLFLMLLGGGIVASAWMGLADSTSDKERASPDSLATYIIRRSDMVPQMRIANPLYDQVYQQQRIYRSTRALLPLAAPLGAARADEWRGKFREPGQTYNQYLHEFRKVGGGLMVQPVGSLPMDQKMALGHVLETMSAFFGVPVKCAPAIPLASLPPGCFRLSGGRRQINAEALMEQVLEYKLGSGVSSVIAYTTLDLYPGDKWPFESAYGWSSFSNGTAVLSTRKILSDSRADRGLNLLRIVKLGVHELAHTLGIKHCKNYSCLMNGCSDLAESDSKPLVLCPDCLAKLSLATGRDPRQHLSEMYELCKEKGFSTENRYYYRAVQLLH